jgi:hypothetical protein
VKHKNFYENTKEARMRLLNTIVLYDGEPQYIIAITDHKGDGIFRAYSLPIGEGASGLIMPGPLHNIPHDHAQLGPQIDEWMAANKGHKVQRKHLSSPLFNKFRPFPLGMCNVSGRCYYIERQPNRKTEQGLIKSMLLETRCSLVGEGPRTSSASTDIYGKDFYRTIKGEYPSAERCLSELKNPNIENEGAAFHRQFAFIRGPIGMIFVAYKGDIVGVLPNGDLSTLRLGRKYLHCKEVVSELKLFDNVTQ